MLASNRSIAASCLVPLRVALKAAPNGHVCCEPRTSKPERGLSRQDLLISSMDEAVKNRKRKLQRRCRAAGDTPKGA